MTSSLHETDNPQCDNLVVANTDVLWSVATISLPLLDPSRDLFDDCLRLRLGFKSFSPCDIRKGKTDAFIPGKVKISAIGLGHRLVSTHTLGKDLGREIFSRMGGDSAHSEVPTLGRETGPHSFNDKWRIIVLPFIDMSETGNGLTGDSSEWRGVMTQPS